MFSLRHFTSLIWCGFPMLMLLPAMIKFLFCCFAELHSNLSGLKKHFCLSPTFEVFSQNKYVNSSIFPNIVTHPCQKAATCKHKKKLCKGQLLRLQQVQYDWLSSSEGMPSSGKKEFVGKRIKLTILKYDCMGDYSSAS